MKVYDAASNGKLIGTAIVGQGGSTAEISTSQLGLTAGKVFVSITSPGKIIVIKNRKSSRKI